MWLRDEYREDGLSAFKGIFYSVLFSIVFWTVFYFIVKAVV